MGKLIPFDLRSPCPKCGGRGMDARYCMMGHAGQEKIGDFNTYQEHLDLTCQRCGYTRYMATRDGHLESEDVVSWRHPGPRSGECGLNEMHEGPCRRLE